MIFLIFYYHDVAKICSIKYNSNMKEMNLEFGSNTTIKK